jgi:hypothetical protein
MLKTIHIGVYESSNKNIFLWQFSESEPSKTLQNPHSENKNLFTKKANLIELEEELDQRFLLFIGSIVIK